MILPAISDLYDSYYALHEKISQVRVITAIEIKEDFRQHLKLALAKRIRGDVTLNCEVDPSIIAGAIIHVGDRVIDGSIRGKLTRLLEFSLR
jgi:F-type H+-transporting ATPase subunit delta